VSAARYDAIGRGYGAVRRADPRIARRLHGALGDASRVLNVGAGAGSYEPTDRPVVALEPSPVMIAQRPLDAAPVVRGVAERLPFRADEFGAALAVLTVHHWSDLGAGLAELRRVAARQVVLLFEPDAVADLWMLDYWPEVLDLPTERAAPGSQVLAQHLDVRSIEPVPVPHDCTDGFAGAFWARPERYLDPGVQAGMSTLAQLDPEVRARGADRLRDALASGAWDRRHGALRRQDAIDLGYRLLVAGG
jgi:SAM-dependent methyltransferase